MWDNRTFSYDYSAGGQFNRIRDPGSLTLVDYNYNTKGELIQAVKYLSAPDQSWTYDPIGRLASTTIDSPTNTFDVTWSYTRNPASQIRSETQTNDSYRWNAFQPVNRTYTTNGLNQYTGVSGQGYCYDPNGNLTADGEYVYLYDVENRLVEMRAQGTGNGNCLSLSYAGQAKALLRYDPLGRLFETTNYIGGMSQGARRFLHDGDALVAEFNAAGTLLARHVHGPAAGADDPLVSYEGASVAISAARFLQSDARGSIVYSSTSSDGSRVVNTYDEYGQPGTANAGRFQYTGQAWLPELGMYYYKARIYSPRLGRFMQTDPIGYEDNVNLYGYVGGDPVNFVDQKGEDAVTVARGALGFIAADVATPEPTDAAAPKWIAYAAVTVIATGVILYASSDDQSVEDKRRRSAPSDKPKGIKPIDKSGIGRQGVHDIKDGIGAAPDDWVGVDKNGDIYTTNPETGKAEHQGNIEDYDLKMESTESPKKVTD